MGSYGFCIKSLNIISLSYECIVAGFVFIACSLTNCVSESSRLTVVSSFFAFVIACAASVLLLRKLFIAKENFQKPGFIKKIQKIVKKLAKGFNE